MGKKGTVKKQFTVLNFALQLIKPNSYALLVMKKQLVTVFEGQIQERYVSGDVLWYDL